ncbi:MAG: transglutaminase-like putative cysteine protease [Pseudohongiellaceae bacterium]|jgi:transglutaminase-like putative cysteine protease
MNNGALHSIQGLAPSILRALIIGFSYWIVSISLTVLSGSVAAFGGCLAACLLSDMLRTRDSVNRLRTTSLLALSVALFFSGALLSKFLVNTSAIAALFSPVTAFNIAEAVKWFAAAFALSAALRLLATRTSVGAVIEILFVAGAFVITLAAHRNGMIHRPFFIGDFALTRGIDPSTILLAFGCVAVLSLSALLMAEQHQRRLPYHFAVLGLLCFSLIGYVKLFGLPTPQMTDDLGLTGSEGNSGAGQNENPFRDSENTADDKQAPVAVVVFRDDYEPVNGSYYFRESAYSQFNGTVLDFSNRADMDADLIKNFSSGRVDTRQLPGAQDQRTPVRTTIGTLVAHRSPFGLNSPVAYESTPNPNNLRFKRTYDAYSLAPGYDFDFLLGRETGRSDWSKDLMSKYLELPDDPRYLELATALTSNLRPEYVDDPYAKAWAIKTYLDENGIYSLKNDHAYETDPAASFLFGDLTGYCMHFSFAATYLYRSLGIPARVGIGYSVPAANRGGGSSLLIQAINGHAWPEIYFKDVGWVIVDPAPQQTLVDMTTDPQNELQQLLGDMLRDEAAFDDYLETRQDSLIDLEVVLNTLYALLMIMLLSSYMVKTYRQWAPSFGKPQNQHWLIYRASLDLLSAAGLYREYGESREQFASRTCSASPSMQILTAKHLEIALGGTETKNLNKQQWLQLKSAVALELRESASTGRRTWAILNPITWLWSK